MKKILFTVTNELNYDQRMQRICTTLQENGYAVKLIGRKDGKSRPLSTQVYQQKRLRCFCAQGPFFYVEYNIRLFFYLLFQKTDAICAIDLDTILPVYFVSFLRKRKRIYDAHELFTEMKEIVTRPRIHRFWKKIETFSVPRFPKGYTVNQTIADIFKKQYGVQYAVVRNFAKRQTDFQDYPADPPFLLYQGSVNEGRGFEQLIPAMRLTEMPLRIYGKGNFLKQLNSLIEENGVKDKVQYMGEIAPELLKRLTPTAYLGILLMDRNSMNNYYSLANRFTDYMMAGIPQVCVGYPEYQRINDQYGFADLLEELTSECIAKHINHLIKDKAYYSELKSNAISASSYLCWEEEQQTLIHYYNQIVFKKA